MGLENFSELAEAAEGEVGVADDGGALPVFALFAVAEDGETVVGRRHPGLLDVFAEDVVEEGGFAGGMVADDKDERAAGDFSVGGAFLESKPVFHGVEDLVIKRFH